MPSAITNHVVQSFYKASPMNKMLRLSLLNMWRNQYKSAFITCILFYFLHSAFITVQVTLDDNINEMLELHEIKPSLYRYITHKLTANVFMLKSSCHGVIVVGVCVGSCGQNRPRPFTLQSDWAASCLNKSSCLSTNNISIF